MKNEYNHAIDQIHAPQDLIASTKKAMKEEQANLTNNKQIELKSKSYINIWRNSIIAASICLVVFGSGVGYYKVNNYILVDTAIFEESNSLEIGISLGKIDMEEETDNILKEQFADRTELLSKIWEASPSKIKGITIHIAQGEESNSFYAAYKKEEKYYLITGKSISLDEFIKYLKKNI